jgi:hypothetical protein
MKKTVLLLLWALVGLVTTAYAQEGISDYQVFHETDTIWHFGYQGVNLYSRKMHRIDIAYPSSDKDGNPVTMSGYVCIPDEVYSGAMPCDGMLIYNHFTNTAAYEAPTRGFAVGIDFVMANPLKPNYIVVCSDYIGFGLTADRPQVYCIGDANGQASIDCLLAARKLLDVRGISQGKYLFNAGISSGGYDALATQRVRDMKYRDEIRFDKTIVGGVPFDLETAYEVYIEGKDDASWDPTCLLMMLDQINRYANLGFTYEQMFTEELSPHFKEWFLSGKYRMAELLEKTKGKTMSDLVRPEFLSKRSPEYKTFTAAAREYSLANGWTPDSTASYYVMHLARDKVVPTAAGRKFLEFLHDFDYDGKTCDGFTKSIVPERTRLQTNFLIPSESHTLVGGIVCVLKLAATLTAYPVLYYDGELNTHYADFIEPATLMGIIKLLESKGYDVRGMVKKLTEGSGEGGTDFFSMLSSITQTLEEYGTSLEEVMLIASDSGVEISDILEVYQYLTADPDPAEAKTRRVATESDALATEPMMIDYYQQYLTNWLNEETKDK